MSALFSLPEALTQDVHFTQIHAAPLLINPANTGVSEVDFRLVNNYRNQWRQIEAPYNTYSISADRRIFSGPRALGIGASLVHDLSSGSYLVTDKFHISVSYSLFRGNHQFVLGLQPGLVFRRFNQDEVTFGSQFSTVDNRFNAGLPSYESLLTDRLFYFDGNAGFLWRAVMEDYRMTAGIAVFHLNRPAESFMKNNEEDHLPVRYHMHAGMLIPLTERISLHPMVLYSATSGAREFIGGSLLGFSFPAAGPVKSIYALASLRVNPVRNMDAVMIGTGISLLNFDVFLSYDINISTFRKATNFYGAFEVSLVYRNLSTRLKESIEPCYML